MQVVGANDIAATNCMRITEAQVAANCISITDFTVQLKELEIVRSCPRGTFSSDANNLESMPIGHLSELIRELDIVFSHTSIPQRCLRKSVFQTTTRISHRSVAPFSQPLESRRGF